MTSDSLGLGHVGSSIEHLPLIQNVKNILNILRRFVFFRGNMYGLSYRANCRDVIKFFMGN